jgi:S1/P1 Nuclease
MRLFRCVTAATAALCLALPAAAWNYSGHWIVAEIAYGRLTPQARVRVDELIRNHPDYDSILTKGAPLEPAARVRYAFVYAAAWPDLIRGDSRFYDETRPDAKPTPPVAGFPDMMRHGTWHYYDIPISGDGTPVVESQPPHLMTELPRLLAEIATANPLEAAYDLPWLEHLTGDAHQPLHATSRFLKSQPKGDAGGNLVIVHPGRTLHSLWDDAAAPRDLGYQEVVRYAREIAAEHPARGLGSLDPKQWIAESFRLDKSAVYTFGLETGSKQHPLTLPAGYEEKANRLARRRVALAGYRLAAVLNQRLQ